jgi:hypothetical protein
MIYPVRETVASPTQTTPANQLWSTCKPVQDGLTYMSTGYSPASHTTAEVTILT